MDSPRKTRSGTIISPPEQEQQKRKMVRDGKDRARESGVAFILDGQKKMMPGSNHRKNDKSPYHRMSMDAQASIPTDPETAESATMDLEDQDAILGPGECHCTFDDYHKFVTPQLDKVVFKGNAQTTYKDLEAKILQLCDLYDGHGEETGIAGGFHWTAIRDDVAEVVPFSGIIDEKKYLELHSEYPTEMYNDGKSRTLLLVAYKEQNDQLLKILMAASSTINRLDSWVNKLEDFHKHEIVKVQDNAADLAIGGDDLQAQNVLLAQLAEEQSTVTDLRDVISGQAARLLTLERKLHDHENARNPSPRREPTPASDVTISASKRTDRIADPCVFYHEKNRDEVPFEVWERNKIQVNRDHFADDFAVRAYIESRLGGTAAADLAPYLRDSNPHRLQTSKELMDHLHDQYTDKNLAAKARDQFERLRLTKTDDFTAFMNQFVRLAGECGILSTRWKEEIQRKMTPSLKVALASAFDDTDVDFSHFCRLASAICYTWTTAQSERDQDKDSSKRKQDNSQNTTSRPKNTGRSGGGSSAGSTTTRLAPATFDPSKLPAHGYRAPKADEVPELLSKGLCFTCRKPGHLKKDCPEREMAKLAHEHRVNNILSWATKEDDSSKTSTPAKEN